MRRRGILTITRRALWFPATTCLPYGRYPSAMGRVSSINPYASLAASVEEASRLSFACAFSSSEEFEAALIKKRREAGHYGPSPRRRHGAVGLVLGLLIVICLVIF